MLSRAASRLPAGGGNRAWQVLVEFAEVLATGDPRVWQRLLAEHTADHLGRCRRCRRDRWPCSLHGVALRAAHLSSSPDTAVENDGVVIKPPC